MALSYSDEQIQAKAEQLGLVEAGCPVPRSQRSRVVAALVAESPRAAEPQPPAVARQITVQPGGDITIDGQPFPWTIGRTPIEVCVNPDGVSTVRLTLLTESVQILKPAPSESENRA